jgi:predicted metalloprotease
MVDKQSNRTEQPMRWTPGGRSRNLEDRRGASPGGGGFRMGGGAGLGAGGLLLLAVLSLVFKRDLISEFTGEGTAVPSQSADGAIVDPAEEDMVLFVSSVLDSAQATWARLLPSYPEAKLVLFRDAVESACGFAQAYVLAHEIGHHVQNVTGTERQVRAAQQRTPGAVNQYSVALELQADCYAGVWAHSAGRSGQLEGGDFEEGLTAASAVGDDRLQKMGGGRVNPETFTHGSSEERRSWFKRGFDSGDPNRCDTFAGR